MEGNDQKNSAQPITNLYRLIQRFAPINISASAPNYLINNHQFSITIDSTAYLTTISPLTSFIVIISLFQLTDTNKRIIWRAL